MYQRICDHFPVPLRGKVLSISPLGYLRRIFTDDCDVTGTSFPEVKAESLPFADHLFDFVVIDQVLEHVSNPWKVVEELYRVTKPHGIVILTTVFLYPYHGCKDYGDHWRFTPQGLRLLFERFSRIHQCEGWGNLDAFYGCFKLGLTFVEESALPRELVESQSDKNAITVWIVAEK